MLKGHVFSLQTFTNGECAYLIDKLLNGNSGILRGCTISKTNDSVTIAAGEFIVKGRPMQIIGNQTISDITTNGYYSLICEIDLSKINTESQLNQAVIKTLYGSSAYPSLTQQDLFDDGTVYQYEFARFRVASGSITDLTDRRTTLDMRLLKNGGTTNGDYTFDGNIIADNISNSNRSKSSL